MIDLDSHRIIDLIPTRNTEEVNNWPAEYPNIEVISRDVAQIYASAAKKSHPEVIQVHIIKGLTDAVTRYLIREFPARIEIPAGSVNSDEIKRLQNINNRSEIVDRIIVKEKKHLLALQQKQQEVDCARKLAKNGIPIEQIAKERASIEIISCS